MSLIPSGARRPLRVLLLGGTAEATELAAACADRPDLDVRTSLAGVLAAPARPAGSWRIGGFGGPDGLAEHLRQQRIGALVDATHPFAATITSSAVAAADRVGVPLVLVRRPGWTAAPGDDWRRVPSLAAAAALAPELGERVFLSVGRRGIAPFAGVDRCWFLARCLQAPGPPLPPRLSVLLDRGPFRLDAERALLARHGIAALVSKDSGGESAAAKLTAARERGIPVILVDRPPTPPGARVLTGVPAAVQWLVSWAASGAAGTCP